MAFAASVPAWRVAVIMACTVSWSSMYCVEIAIVWAVSEAEMSVEAMAF